MFVSSSDILYEYNIHSKIGGENFSTIYEATRILDGAKRAIKVMDLDKFCSVDSDFYAEVNKQICLLQRINNGGHANIIHYYKISHFDHYIIFEMQYINGSNINDYLNENNYFVETKEVINLLIDIGKALKFLHYDICYENNNENACKDTIDRNTKINNGSIEVNRNNFVVHNDIHTWNILRDVSGKYYLIDLDFAIENTPNVYEQRNHIDLIGAPWFKAPEKWDQSGYIGTQSDMYSFGIVLYWFLTGFPPFSLVDFDIQPEKLLDFFKNGPTSVFELRKRNFERRFPNKTYAKDYPNWLELLILKCLKKDPNERFKDGNELLEYVMSNLV